MSLAAVTLCLSRVGAAHPDLVQDDKVRRYILLMVEEAKKLPAERAPIAPVDLSEV